MKKICAVILCLMVVCFLSACGGKDMNISDEPQYYEGGISDTMNTYFFDFTVNSAVLTDSYGDVTLEEDAFLVASVTVKNTTNDAITMYDTDFQAQWDEEADDAYSLPITYEYEDGLLDTLRQLPSEYELKAGESKTGELVFVVPAGREEYSISYLELFTDSDGKDVEGDVFFVFFKP